MTMKETKKSTSFRSGDGEIWLNLFPDNKVFKINRRFIDRSTVNYCSSYKIENLDAIVEVLRELKKHLQTLRQEEVKEALKKVISKKKIEEIKQW